MATKKPRTTSAPFVTWLALALLMIVLDQLSKILILGHFDLSEGVRITSFFNIVRVHNTGAAFSFLAHADGWQRWFFVGLGIAASGLFLWMIHQHRHQKLFAFSVSMLLGGALGNVVDRLWHGYVVDFLQFHFSFLEMFFQGGYFPSFNVADMAITAGATGLILDELLRVRRSR